MTHAFEPTTPSRDANALLALTVVLIVTTWSFFGRFSIVAAAAGIGTGLWLHWWYSRHPASSLAAGRRPQMLNISAIYIGGDAAGLDPLEGGALPHAAPDLVDEGAQGGAHRHLDHAGREHAHPDPAWQRGRRGAAGLSGRAVGCTGRATGRRQRSATDEQAVLLPERDDIPGLGGRCVLPRDRLAVAETPAVRTLFRSDDDARTGGLGHGRHYVTARA